MTDRAHATLERLWREAVEAHSARPAARDDDRALTYAEVDAASDEVAAVLRKAGAGPGESVLLHLERTTELAVHLLAVLKTGAAWIAIDRRHSRARREVMARASGAVLHVDDAPDRPLAVDATVLAPVAWEGGVPLGGPKSPPAPWRVAPRSAATALFTSGSSGEPKQVVLEHRNLVAFAVDAVLPRPAAGDVTGQVASVSFDAFHYELWCSWASGACVQFLPDVAELLEEGMGARLARDGVSTMLLPTMAFHHIARIEPTALSVLTLLCVGGDVFPPTAAGDVRRGGFRGRLVNLYGPSETTTAVTAYEFADHQDEAVAVPLGVPLAHAQLSVVDDLLQDVAPGQAGELCVGGAGVGRGYQGDPRRTAASFVPAEDGSRRYRTGDVVRQREDGMFEFLGRRDRQVKVRGYRVDPDDVERTLVASCGAAACAVAVLGKGDDRRLVALVVPGQKGFDGVPRRVDRSSDLLRRAADALPDHAVPTHALLVPSLPTTPHGKRDWSEVARVLSMALDEGDKSTDTPVSGVLARVRAVVAAVVGEELVGLDVPFEQLGVNSLSGFRIRFALEKQFDIKVATQELSGSACVRSLAEAVDAHLDTLEDGRARGVRPEEGTARAEQ